MSNLYIIDGVKVVVSQNKKTGFWRAVVRASVSKGVFFPSGWILQGGFTSLDKILEQARSTVPINLRYYRLEAKPKSPAFIQAAVSKTEAEYDWSTAIRIEAYSEAEAVAIQEEGLELGRKAAEEFFKTYKP
jgi:hypothetical protein